MNSSWSDFLSTPRNQGPDIYICTFLGRGYIPKSYSGNPVVILEDIQFTRQDGPMQGHSDAMLLGNAGHENSLPPLP